MDQDNGKSPKYEDIISKNKINIGKISNQKIKDLIFSIDTHFQDIINKRSSINVISIFKQYAKVLEIIIDQKISKYFKPHLNEKYNKGFIHNKDIRIKFGNLQQNKMISLNTLAKIFRDFKEEPIDKDLLLFKTLLKGKIEDNILNEIEDTNLFLLNLTNPKQHTKDLGVEEVILNRNSVISRLNQIIDNLY